MKLCYLLNIKYSLHLDGLKSTQFMQMSSLNVKYFKQAFTLLQNKSQNLCKTVKTEACETNLKAELQLCIYLRQK